MALAMSKPENTNRVLKDRTVSMLYSVWRKGGNFRTGVETAFFFGDEKFEVIGCLEVAAREGIPTSDL